jgi:hypothetical protein
VRESGDWAAFEALALENWRGSARRRGVAPDGISEGLTSWEGIDGVVQVDDLPVEPGARGRGLAAAPIRCGVTQCRAAGAGPVVIVADAADTRKDADARMGFGPVAVLHEYLLQVRAESH